MRLRDSIQKKSRKLFDRTLQSLKHLLPFDGYYHKLSRRSSFRSFASASCREPGGRKAHRPEDSYSGYSGKWTQTEESYSGFSGKWPRTEEAKEEGGVDKRQGSIIKEEEEAGKKAEKGKLGNSQRRPHPPSSSSSVKLARKMKELEMMELGDMEHELDVEEALHYYSRLTSPVYVEIVDKFFMDMYSDFSPSPAARVPCRSSLASRRLGQRRAAGRPFR